MKIRSRPHLEDRTGRPEDHSCPWSCSGDRGPFRYASGLQTTGVEIRQNQAVQGDQGTRRGASEGSACKLEEREKAEMLVVRRIYLEAMQLPQRLRCTCRSSPLSWPMADWFMEECMMLSDWTLGGRGGIWLPAAQEVNTFRASPVGKASSFQKPKLLPGTAAGDSGPVREGVTLAGEPTGEGEGPRMPGR